MKRVVVLLVIAWAVLMLVLDPPRQMTESEWQAEQMKWGLP